MPFYFFDKSQLRIASQSWCKRYGYYDNDQIKNVSCIDEGLYYRYMYR